MTWFQGAQLLVELIEHIAWPVAIVVMVWRLGPPFIAMLGGRPLKFEGFGVKGWIGAKEQQANAGDSPTTRPPLEPPAEQLPAIDRPALQLIEQRVRGDLAQFVGPARENALVRAIAMRTLTGAHEYTYNRIFGSQIAGLKRLDEIGGATIDDARAFFAPYEKQFPDLYQNYGFDRWLNFMVGTGLVERVGERLTATAYGHDFLIYLREARLTESKAG